MKIKTKLCALLLAVLTAFGAASCSTADQSWSAKMGDESLPELLQKTREQAQTAKAEHPNHLLYTQLAQSLLNWCDLLEGVMQDQGESIARNYARATMCVLCFELRKALLDEGIQSEASTASAQRTPSTAADVMPPA